ncbi:DUF305 domain-containing protein [Stenotrophomonas indicatrix]|uniref:DUF305 domain-containing protein n=1 Tax=Stenotrophomonas indicatrix TaxID=2045451 RepID=UPI0007397D69|nr:DUF305 domain-containing protein [Stenotrophomonas indicatrix]CRD45322.1 conserved membrane hypothetical protein [Stenotrophomonas indicatrix]
MSSHPTTKKHRSHYARLLVMIVLSFLVMYSFMYAMVDRWENVYGNVNQFYMAGLMASPMLLIEILLMSAMYPNRRWNALLCLGALVFMAVCWIGIRQQAAVSDRQFMRSMIPHHAGAILMCEQAHLSDRELQRLCKDIVASQRAEIAQMKTLLEE